MTALLVIGAALLALAAVYALAGAAFFRFGMDGNVIVRGDSRPTREDARLPIATGDGRVILVRRYGPTAAERVALFFPGKNGRLGHFETTLFPFLRAHGFTVYALAYPGQDGSSGSRRLSTIEAAIMAVIRAVEADAGRPASRMAFLGRSLGATVAILAADRAGAGAVLVEGASPSLAHATRAFLRRSMFMRPLAALPIARLLPVNFEIAAALRRRGALPCCILQGTRDTVTPLADMQALAAAVPGLLLVPVAGATHDDAYLVGRERYLEWLDAFAPRTLSSSTSEGLA